MIFGRFLVDFGVEIGYEAASAKISAQVAFRWCFRRWFRSILRDLLANCFSALHTKSCVFLKENIDFGEIAGVIDGRFDETCFRNSPSIRNSISVSIWSDFDEKSDENRSRIGCESEFPPKSAVEALLGTFWPRLSRLWGAWGRSWETFSPPGAPQASPGGALARPRASQVDPRWRKSSPKLPKSTELGRKMRSGTDFGPMWVDFGGFGVDFWSILESKSVAKLLLRKSQRRLLFDGVFDDGFDRFCEICWRTAFQRSTRKVVFSLRKTQIFAKSLG